MFSAEGQISVVEAKNWILEKKKAYLFDLRSEAGFKKYNINHFQNIPASKINKVIPQIDSDNIVFFICEDGTESVKAQKVFASCGIETYVIRGGINDWKKIFNV